MRVVGVAAQQPTGFSAELCGGTSSTPPVRSSWLSSPTKRPIGAGLRRIEAVTGAGADESVRRQRSQMMEVARLLEASSTEEVHEKLDTMLLARDAMQRSISKMARHWARDLATELLQLRRQVSGISLVVAKVPDPPDTSPETMRSMADDLRNGLEKVGGGVAVVGYPSGDKPGFIALVTKIWWSGASTPATC